MRRQRTAPQLYAGYAALFLVVTLLAGIWLRGALLQPRLLGGFTYPHLLHAHSHLAFFGWTTMALFALVAAAAGPRTSARLVPHAHLVGVASAAAFVGFLLGGYTGWTIALSVLHVGLWVAFARVVWRPLARAGTQARRYYRAALLFLLLAGAGAMTPAIVMVRGIEDPWISQLSVQAFLTPFLSGWLMLGVMGAIYARLGGWRAARGAGAALWLVALGALPTTFLHTPAAPPTEWLTLLGQAGALLVGAGTVLFGVDVLRARLAPLVQLVGAAALLKGGAELGLASGWMLELAGIRALAVVYLHLVLLGVVTPALLATTQALPVAPRRVAAYAAGVAAMLGALLGLGWPGVATALAGAGISVTFLLQLALLGGLLAVAAVVALLVPVPLRRLSTLSLRNLAGARRGRSACRVFPDLPAEEPPVYVRCRSNSTA